MYLELAIALFASTSISLLVTSFVSLPSKKEIGRPNLRHIYPHDKIPRFGGIALLFSFLATTAITHALPQRAIGKEIPLLLKTGIGGTLILLIGLIDDLRNLNSSQKFIGQFLTVLLIFIGETVIKKLHLPFLGETDLPFLMQFALTLFWLLGVINIVNLIDGIDGLSSGVTIIASLTFLTIAIAEGKFTMAIIFVITIGATLGFLWYNWHPAKIFIGDCGAMFLGFILAAISIELCYNSSNPSLVFAPVLTLGLPIADTTYAIIRRSTTGKSSFTADRGHIHHQLMKLGFSVPKTTLILYGVCIAFGTIALLTTQVSPSIGFAISAIAILLTIILVKTLHKITTFS